MFTNMLRITLRNLWRDKVYSFINVFGFSVGIAAFLLIFLFVKHELSYDRFFENAEDIYLVREDVYISGQWNHWWQSVTPLAPAIAEDIPEVMSVARVYRWFDMTVHYGETKYNESNVGFTDPSFFEVFSYPLVYGVAGEALSEPNTVALNRTLAEKYFGDENPIGQVVRLQDQHDMTVVAVFEDMPDNSSIQLNVLVSFSTLLTHEWMGPREGENWRSFNNETYARLYPGTDPETVDARFEDLIIRHDGDEGWSFHRPSLMPHVTTHLRGDYRSITLLLGIALFILVLACINFTNLSTAQSAKRMREIGVRKVLGGTRGELIRQFLGESLILTTTAMVIAVLLVELMLPLFTNVIGKDIDLSLLGNWMVPGMIALTIVVGLLAGSYPAFYLSGFRPIGMFKGFSGSGKRKPLLRRVLAIIQFSITIALVISTVTIVRQHNYLRTRDLGFDRENLIYLPLNSHLFRNHIEAFKEEINSNSRVLSSCISSRVFGRINGGFWSIRKPGDEDALSIMTIFADEDVLTTLGANVTWGAVPGEGESLQLRDGFILNSEAVERLGIDPDVDDRLILSGEKEGRLINVLGDLHVHSLYRATLPMVITGLRRDGEGNINQYDCRFLLIRVSEGPMQEVLQHLQQVWERFDPNMAFEYHFLDDDIENQYRSEQQFASILGSFAVIAIVIACLGLFGLSAYDTEQRTKEIGIRKVLGATVFQIISLLSRDFAKPVLFANLAAWPIAYLVMNSYLGGFPYRVNAGFLLYALVGAVVLGIAVAVVSGQTMRAATTQPAITLRDE